MKIRFKELNADLNLLNMQLKVRFSYSYYDSEHTEHSKSVVLLCENESTVLNSTKLNGNGDLHHAFNEVALTKVSSYEKLAKTEFYLVDELNNQPIFQRIFFSHVEGLFSTPSWLLYRFTLGRMGDLPLIINGLRQADGGELLMISKLLKNSNDSHHDTFVH